MPIVFTVGEQRFAIKSATLGVEPDWSAALATALREGSGFAPVRGYKRLQSRFLGTDIVPPVRVYTAALEYKLGQIADAVDRRHVEAKLVRRGLAVAVVPGQVGRTLERKAAASTIVRALAGLERGKPVALPVVVDPIDVTAADLAPAAKQARVALSAPVRLVYGETRWKLPRWRLAAADRASERLLDEALDRREAGRRLVRAVAQAGRPCPGRREVRHVVGSDLDRPEQARPRGRGAGNCRGHPRRGRLAVESNGATRGRDQRAEADDG